MKLRRVRIQNIRSFLDTEELLLDGNISILIGPNGGGKTNLLDTITTFLRRHLLSSWVYRRTPSESRPDQIQVTGNDVINNTPFEPHFSGSALPQEVEFEVEVTLTDIVNMAKIQTDAARLAVVAEQNGFNTNLRQAMSWDLLSILVKDRFTYRISQNSFQPPSSEAARLFHGYLTLFEADGILRECVGEARLSTPMLSLPVNRAASGFQSSISLSGHSEIDLKKQVDAANSRSAANIVGLAVGRIALRHRLLLDKDLGGAMGIFLEDPQMQSLTRTLESLGYGWELVSVNPLANQYDIRLSKQGKSFFVSSASSGEKELLTYLFGIFALNVRDALVVVDEPELHLHPRWQKTLLALFETLSKETGNQFLLATHSPVFVSASSIQYVSRVFSHDQQSKIVRLKNDSLPEPKHLFGIVNSQNNERMFFTERVVLVEGISDRLLFEIVLSSKMRAAEALGSYEIISVGGKNFFGAYEQVLDAAKVPYVIIADLDYVNQIGTPELKGLFTLNEKKVKASLLEDLASTDGRTFVDSLEHAISTKEYGQLRVLWEYIKGRRSKLKPDLTAIEQGLLDDFLLRKRDDAIYILRLGALEDYLPDGYKSKDLSKVIRLLERPDFWELLPEIGLTELHEIAQSIADRFHAVR